MPINRPQGLRGLQGLGSLSKAQYDSFINKNRDLISQHGYDPVYINNLYSNKQFIDKYGIEKFKAIPDIDMRNTLYKDDIVNTEFTKLYSPINTDGTRNNQKGLGADFEKYNQLSTDAKLKLMESSYLTPSEFENAWQKDINKYAKYKEATNKGFSGFLKNAAQSMNVTGGLYTNIDNDNNELDNEALKRIKRDANNKILQNIYNDDIDNHAKNLGAQVSQTYLNDPYITGLSDKQVKEAFVQAITPGSYKDKNGMTNMGISEFASHYGNGSENQVTSEMKNFSIDDMRQILAKKKVYEANMSPDMAATALNNEAKKYIKEHQGSLKKFGLFAKDVGISAMSYSADKLNGIAELYRAGQDAYAEKPIVMVDDKGNVLDPNKTKVVRDKQGGLHYKDSEGTLHSVHKMQVDYTTLHNMGKNPDGSDIKGAFGIDWMTLNPQYWTRAEQFGTLDENEQKQYEKIGSSPYKVAYNPNEDNDLWYESFKMMSFGLADAAAQAIPFGIGTVGKALSTASKVGKLARGFGKVLDTTGKLLTAETKVGQVAQGTAGALGIAYAYNRGTFQETLQQNLANAEEAAMTASRNDIYNQYHTDKNYKASVDRLIKAKAVGLKAEYIAQMHKDGGMKIADEKALDKMLHAKAQEAVLGELVQNRVKERMSSKEYANLQQKAIDGAGDAAFNTFWPEAIKYGFVNTMGYRKFLYTNPAGLSKKMSTSLKGLKEITTAEGRKRLTTDASKFLTRADKWKEFGKSLGSQAWGGFWTNGTDDMQVDAAERINEDSFNRYLHSYQNGEALANTYGFADGIYSYIRGLKDSMGQETTWNAGTVGALGSIVNFTPNFANLARLATKEGREAYRNSFRREIERDENGNPLKNEDGSVKYKDLGKGNDWRGQMNYFIQNGVLNTYYGKKQAERDLRSHADYVNNLLDEYNDFVDIEHLVASNIASENVESLGDQKTMDFIKALHAVNTLDKLGEDSNDPTTMSSVVQNAKTLIEKASLLNLEEGKNPFSEEEIFNLLSQYYASHPEIEQDEYTSQKALYEIAQNAQKLQKATEAFNKAEDEIQKIEKNNGISISPEVRTKMKVQQALNDHWKERKEKMQSEISDSSPEYILGGAVVTIAAVGGVKNAQSLIKVYDKQRAEIEKELEEQNKKTESLYKEYTKSIDEEDTARSEGNSDAILDAQNKKKEAKAKLDASREQESYLEDLIFKTSTKGKGLQAGIDYLESDNHKEDKNKILTADEIFTLDPVTRARMMKVENRELYSKEQQREIEKLEKRLLMKDADALQKIQDIALLSQRISANQDAYSRMAKNPEAAAVELEAQRAQAAEAAYKLINQRNAETIADYINEFDEGMKGHADITDEAKNKFVFKTLRKLNSTLLDTIDEDTLLPQYQQQVKDAKEWGKTVDDIMAVISQSNRDETWKENTLKNIDTIVENSNNKAEILASLEKVIDDINNPDATSSLDYVLNGLESLGYQRDATTLENRKQRKAREVEEKKKKEDEAKKVEAETKAAAEKKVSQSSTDNIEYLGNEEDVDLFGNSEESEPTTQVVEEEDLQQTDDSIIDAGSLMKDNFGNGSIDMGDMLYGTTDNPKKGRLLVTKEDNSITFKVNGKDTSIEITPDEYETVTDEQENKKNSPFIANSIEKKDGDWYFIGNFVGDKESTEVKVKKDFNIDQAIERQQAANEAALAAKGIDTGNKNLIDNGDSVQGKSETIDEQLEDTTSTDKEVHSSDDNVDAAELNGTGQHNIETSVTTLSGNAMSEYNPTILQNDGIIERKKGSETNDNMNQYYAWMNAAGVKLQSIIDHELARIIRRNPNAKVKFMAVKPERNATNDVAMQSHLMLVLDYDNNINKGITAIHDDTNGGVIESNGKKYLIIGTAGYGNRNASKLALYDMLWNPYISGGLNLKKQRKQFFDAHPSERFYVNENLSTEIVPASLIPGYIVRQTESDNNSEFRSVRELLSDNARNPMHYDLDSVAWGIQERSKFLVVGASLDKVMVPRDPMGNLGSAFVLMSASNGKMVPSYLKVLKYNEMRDGSLKDKINTLLQEVTSPNYKTRLNAVIGLSKIFYFDKEGDTILLRKNRDEISLVHDGKVQKTFVLNDNFDRADFMQNIQDMNPRINITASILRDIPTLMEYDEAGALMTDAALFGTVGSSYCIYGLDGDGKMIKPESPTNDIPKSSNNSDFKNGDKSQVIFKHQYYREVNGVFSLNGEIITDEATLKQLKYNKMILDNQLSPSMTQGVWDYFILSEGENPRAIKVNRNTKEVKESSEEQARELIEKINEKEAKKLREQKAQEVIKEVGKAEEVDLGEDTLSVDPNTGELVQADTQSTSSITEESTDEKQVSPTTEKTNNKDDYTHTSSESLNSSEHKAATQKFSDLIKDKKYMLRVMKLVRNKWKDAPKKIADLEKFLRDKNVEVDAIGTTENDIEAWIRTIEDCR
nr:MAG TPA: chromosome segregation ATPase [Caudoviricetes sp.]